MASEEGAERFIITPHQGLSRLRYEEDDEAKLLREAEEVLKKMDEEDAETCPECGGELQELGQLGNRMHYRCRNCGMDFSSKVKSEEEARASYPDSDPWECPVCHRRVTVPAAVHYRADHPELSPEQIREADIKRFGKQEEKCPDCNGEGILPESGRTCSRCDGTGTVLNEEDEEDKLLQETEETLAKMEDYLNNEPMTNMERARGVESAYYEDKSEEGTRFRDPETGETEDYCTDCQIDIGDMSPEQWKKHLSLGHEKEIQDRTRRFADKILHKKYEEDRTCPACHGTGRGGIIQSSDEDVECDRCNGTGKVSELEEEESKLLQEAEETLRNLKEEEEADDYCELHKKNMKDHDRRELEDDLDQISRMRD